VSLLFVGSVLAAGDNKDNKSSVKTKRGYSLGYGIEPFHEVHDVVDHAPIVAHAPIASAIVAHAPAVSVHPAPITAYHHAPIASAVVAHAPIVAPLAKVTSSVVSTNIAHYPSYSSYSYPQYQSQYVASHAPIVASAYHAPASYYQAPASYYQAPASFYQAPSSYYHAPAVVAPTYAHSPLVTEFHRR
jgi:hypothetical protein